MNEEFELITATISLAATAMNENNCRTATGKPAFSGVMQSISRHVILPCAFGKEGRNSSTLCPKLHLWNKTSFGLFHICPRLRAKVPLPPIQSWTWWASPQMKSGSFFFIFDLNNVSLNFLIWPSLYLQTGINGKIWLPWKCHQGG